VVLYLLVAFLRLAFDLKGIESPAPHNLIKPLPVCGCGEDQATCLRFLQAGNTMFFVCY